MTEIYTPKNIARLWHLESKLNSLGASMCRMPCVIEVNGDAVRV